MWPPPDPESYSMWQARGHWHVGSAWWDDGWEREGFCFPTFERALEWWRAKQ